MIVGPVTLLFSAATVFQAPKLTSSVCAACIVLQSLYSVWHGMIAFIVYLILDSTSYKKTMDIYVHHAFAFLLTVCGMIIYAESDKLSLSNLLIGDAILRLLLMEVTTPFLNAVKYLHSVNSPWTKPLFSVLLLLWIVFRIIGPITSLIQLYRLWYFNIGLPFAIVYYSICALFVLQCVWLYKLVKAAVSKTAHRSND
jgi:hypothetical protein